MDDRDDRDDHDQDAPPSGSTSSSSVAVRRESPPATTSRDRASTSSSSTPAPRSATRGGTAGTRLRVFTPARYDALPGLRFPAAPHSFPYEGCGRGLHGDVRREHGPPDSGPATASTSLRRADDGEPAIVVRAGDHWFEAEQVVVATGAYDHPRIPDLRRGPRSADPVSSIRATIEIPASCRTATSSIVGASNSGAEIALDVAGRHHTWSAGRDKGEIPIDTDGRLAPLIDYLLIFAFEHILTLGNPIGRRAAAGKEHGEPVERAKSKRHAGGRGRARVCPDGRRARRLAAARRRPHDPGRERHLGDRLPTELRLDRAAYLR